MTITIDGALANLESFKGILDPATQQRLIDSICLAIEALRGFKSHRDDEQWWWCVLLPGETALQ